MSLKSAEVRVGGVSSLAVGAGCRLLLHAPTCTFVRQLGCIFASSDNRVGRNLQVIARAYKRREPYAPKFFLGNTGCVAETLSGERTFGCSSALRSRCHLWGQRR